MARLKNLQGLSIYVHKSIIYDINILPSISDPKIGVFQRQFAAIWSFFCNTLFVHKATCPLQDFLFFFPW